MRKINLDVKKLLVLLFVLATIFFSLSIWYHFFSKTYLKHFIVFCLLFFYAVFIIKWTKINAISLLYFFLISFTFTFENGLTLYDMPRIFASYWFVFSLAVMLVVLISFFNKYRLKLLSIIIFYFYTIILFAYCGYRAISGSSINTEAIIAVMQTNVSESIGFLTDNISPVLVLMLILMIILSIALLKNIILKLDINSILNNPFKERKYKIIPTILLLALCFVLIYKASDNYQFNQWTNAKLYTESFHEFAENKQERLNSIIFDKSGDNGLYVLVIGESQNRDLMSLYGYERATTPWLSSLVGDNHFVYFSNCYSNHSHTVQTLSMLLTSMNQYNKMPLSESLSIIDVANLCGYETYWYSNQKKYGIYDSPTTVLIEDAKNQLWINESDANSLDENIVNCLDNIGDNDKQFLVIHIMGNHSPYSDRYPTEFNIFGKNNVLDEYCNSLVYNDHIVNNIYEKLSKRKDFKAMIYVSDHSEDVINNLGHNSAMFNKNMINIPFYAFLSESYIKDNADRILLLKENSQEILTNDLIYDFLLGTMNIQINGYNESINDIGSPDFNDDKKTFTTLHGKVNIIDYINSNN